MPAHPRWGQAQSTTYRGRGDRSLLQQQPDDSGASMSLTSGRGHTDGPGTGPVTSPFVHIRQTHSFHNISVAEFVPEI
ncbi:hypothetical protein GCM10011588_04550 [Nocardia jinanensis]|uniref:Uncharacterized protein n=1 Tax=Nocardia jinanensis TaxID=382504 RepID=A0A917R7E5_9NOCA|nr:hypothetical protein GCM10011588_04550 [Nocardia jinanensis]